MNKFRFLILTVIFSMSFSTAFAVSVDKEKTYYDYNSKIFHLEGKAEHSFTPVKMEVLKIGENFEDLTDFKKLMYVGQAYTDENKDFSFDVYAEENRIHIYRISALEDNNIYTDGFSTYTDETVENCFEEYITNENRTVNDLEELIKTFYPKLNFDYRLYQNISENSKNEILSRINAADFENTGDFKNALAKDISIGVIKSILENTEKIIKLDDYKEILGLSDDICYLDFAKYEYEDKAEILTFLESDVNYTNFKSLFNTSFILCGIKRTYYNSIPGFCEKYANISLKELLNPLTNSYVKNVLDEFKEQVAQGKITSEKQIYDAVSKLAEKYLAIQKEESKISTSHSSGGGGGKTYLAPIANIEAPKNETAVKSGGFNDLSDYLWAQEAIADLYEKGIINGRTEETFCPGDYVTREEFLKMLFLALDIKDETDDVYFSDVKKDMWYYPYVVTAKNKKIANGIGDHIFGVGEEITRQDMAVMIYNSLNPSPYEGEHTLNFKDEENISEYAKNAVKFLVQNGILKGTDSNEFKPLSSLTRAEAAVAVQRIMNFSK